MDWETVKEILTYAFLFIISIVMIIGLVMAIVEKTKSLKLKNNLSFNNKQLIILAISIFLIFGLYINYWNNEKSIQTDEPNSTTVRSNTLYKNYLNNKKVEMSNNKGNLFMGFGFIIISGVGLLYSTRTIDK